MTATVRPIVPADVDVVVGLSVRAWAPVFESFRTVMGEQVFRSVYPDWPVSQAEAVAVSCRAEAADVFVAQVQGRPVGYVAVVFHHEGAAACGEIDMLAVDPDHANAGIGSTLTAFAVEHVRACGAVLAVVSTGGDPGHAAARRTYEKAGSTALPTARYYRSLRPARDDGGPSNPSAVPPGPGEVAGDGSGTANDVRAGITEAAHRGTELTTLLGLLQRQQDLVAWKLQDASEEVLRSTTTPSGASLHGLVRHLTNVERSWLRDVFAGQDGLTYDWTEDDPDGEWQVPPGQTMTDLLADYRTESRRCDDVIRSSTSLDAVSGTRDMSLRWILLHLVEETARHLGHVDLLREQADGSTGEEPAPGSDPG